jgi:fucose 4-O-acetylase-like acetyltransferase
MGRDFGVNICTLPQVSALFLYAVKNPDRHAGLIQRVGRDCSMLVYVLHIFVWQALVYVYGAIGVDENTLALYLLPIFVVIMSIMMALLFNWIVLNFKKKPQIIKS